MSERKKAAGRFRAHGLRVLDPRTGQENGSVAQEALPSYLPPQVDPLSAAQLYDLDPWFSAAVDAVATGVGTAEVSPAFIGPDPEQKAEPKILGKMADFLDNTQRTMETVGERLEALTTDYRIQGYCGFEIVRGTDGLPAAWYHVPAATIRARRDLKSFLQVNYLGQTVSEFVPYSSGGNKAKSPELVLIRKYDPSALSLGSSMVKTLASTADRLSAQDSYNRTLLNKGGIPPFLLILKEALDDDSAKRFEAFLKGLAQQGPDAAIGLLDGVGEGKVEKLLQDQEDSSFVKAEEVLRQRILAKAHVPPTKVSLGASNYATAYQEDQTFKNEVTQPILRIFLRRLTALAREFAPPGYFYAFKQSSLEDFYQLVMALCALQEKGDLTSNQVLARLGFQGMGPIGDAHIAYTNQGPVRVEDLVAGNLPPTPGRMMDALLQLRRMISEVQDVRELPPKK